MISQNKIVSLNHCAAISIILTLYTAATKLTPREKYAQIVAKRKSNKYPHTVDLVTTQRCCVDAACVRALFVRALFE